MFTSVCRVVAVKLFTDPLPLAYESTNHVSLFVYASAAFAGVIAAKDRASNAATRIDIEVFRFFTLSFASSPQKLSL